MKQILLLLAVAFATGCATTNQKNKVDDATPYLNSITQKSLTSNLSIVASDEMEGRETGSPGQKKAGDYLISQYKANNVSIPKGAKSYYQTVPAAYLKSKYNHKYGDSENIWAYIEGSEKPEEIVVISAHYDHIGIEDGEIFNGADDDGSGTVALVEIAKAFQKAKDEKRGPKRSILILHVTAEEHGLHGSRYYSDNPLFPIANTVANINIDMIGRRDAFHTNSDYIYLIGSNFLSTDLHNACESANKKYVKTFLDYKFNNKTDPNRFYYRSDHYNFARFGIPSVFLFNGVHEDYHKKTDEVSKIEFDALTKRTKLAFAIAWEIANAENRPVVDKKVD